MKTHFTRLTSKKVYKWISAYDLEWHTGSCCPGGCVPYKLRLVGFYDERGYRAYSSVALALMEELTSDNEGRWFFAHFGGRSDVMFVIAEALRSQKYSVDLSMSGSSAVIMKVSERRSDGKTRSWLFVDSFFLLPVKLADIGEFIGLTKGKLDDAKTAAELQEYNERDCRIVFEAICQMQNILWDLGGELRPTIASCGINLFRREFLHETIHTTAEANELAAASYFASRVERHRFTMKRGNEADVNSSFPYSMLPSHPGSFRGYSKTIPNKGHFIADVTVTMFDHPFPTLPIRRKNRIVFPVGSWRGWYNGIDLRLIEAEGIGRIEKVHKVALYDSRDDLGGYANTIFDLRKSAKLAYERGDKGATFLIQVYKFLLNCLYGKLSEGEEKESFYVNKDPEALRNLGELSYLFPGCYSVEATRQIQHRNVAMAGHIVALSRSYLYYGAKDLGWNVAYMDTDSLHSPGRLPAHYFGEDLGKFKDEGELSDMHYVAPKVYCGMNVTKGKRIHKAKGFSLPKDEAEREKFFAMLMRGESIPVTRMVRAREFLNRIGSVKNGELYDHRGEIIPGPFDVSPKNGKRVYFDGFQKRCMDEKNNTSRPWTFKEIEELLPVLLRKGKTNNGMASYHYRRRLGCFHRCRYRRISKQAYPIAQESR